jgi:hypothetical protein
MGLRFRRSEARFLRAIATRLYTEDVPSSKVRLFERAAECAVRGEPLEVLVEQPDDAKHMADTFIAYGVKPPAVEDLTRRIWTPPSALLV